MLFATSQLYSPMASYVWVSWRNNRRSHSHLSTFVVLKLFHGFHYDYGIFRQRREHRVFQALLQMVPGLEERLVEGSDDEVVAIAETVSYGCIAIQMLYLQF
jgi:hypothetical protein